MTNFHGLIPAMAVPFRPDYSIDEHELVEISRFVMRELNVHPRTELCIRLVDEAAMETLHVQWMDLPGPTDVMSFPMDELTPGKDGEDPEEGMLGDVVLCPSVAQKQADKAGHALEEEILLLTTHGFLHLLGFDHGEPEEDRVQLWVTGPDLVLAMEGKATLG